MIVRFTKNPPAAATDGLTCVHADGRVETAAMPRQGVLPREAVRFVVEATLQWRDGWFGLLARGTPAGDAKGPPATRVKQSEALADCLQAEQWSGATTPRAFLDAVTKRCRAHRVRPPALTPGDLERLRTNLRGFGAAWRPLPPGGSLERIFGE